MLCIYYKYSVFNLIRLKLIIIYLANVYIYRDKTVENQDPVVLDHCTYDDQKMDLVLHYVISSSIRPNRTW